MNVEEQDYIGTTRRFEISGAANSEAARDALPKVGSEWRIGDDVLLAVERQVYPTGLPGEFEGMVRYES